MQTVLAWIVVPCVLASGLPWAAWLIRRSAPEAQPSPWLVLPLGLALSIGALTLGMFWELWIGLPLNFWLITAGFALIMLPGWLLWQRDRQAASRARLNDETDQNAQGDAAGRPDTTTRRLPLVQFTTLRFQPNVRQLALLLLIGIAAAILFNGAYWPFYRADTIGIYNSQALRILDGGALVPLKGPDSLYASYPPLVPLSYVYAFLASGWANEYLAKLIPTLLGVACLPAAFALASEMEGKSGGWLSLFALAFAPTFGRWASAGYADLPSAGFYTLSAVFALRLWRSGRALDAILAGLLMGLAAWTKNSTLVGVAALGVWLLWAWLAKRISLRAALVGLGACALVAAPWYLRNLVGIGSLISDTAWVDRARRDLDTLLIFLTRPEIYGLSGWLIVAAAGLLLARMAQRQQPVHEALLLGLWTLPFFAAWWLFASYDPRLLLPALPVFCVVAGVELAWLWRRLPARWSRPVRWTGIALAVLLGLQVMWISVEFKDEILRDPLMSDAAKHAIVRPRE